jgi:hypothetical protein
MAESQVLVIHVRGQEERRAFIQQQLDGLGLPVHFILEGNVTDLQEATCDMDETLEEILEALCDIDERIG